MRAWITGASVAASLAGAIPGAPALAAEEEPIECSETAFDFSGVGYLVDCTRSETQTRKDGASGQRQTDVITVTSDQRSVFLTVISVRLTSTGLYMPPRGLRESMRDFLEGVELKDWTGIGNKQGYDTAEFTADISGTPSHCIAIQRYLNPFYDGYKRHVIGMGCAANGLDPVYEALAKLKAPGD